MVSYNRRLFAFLVAGLCIACANASFSQQPSFTGSDAIGFVRAYHDQFAAWRSGDVLIRIEFFYDSTGKEGIGRFEESLAYHRFRFDHDAKSYWYYGTKVGKRGQSNGKEPMKETKTSEATAFSILNGVARDRTLPFASRDAKFLDWQSWVDSRKVYDLAFGNIAVNYYGGHGIKASEEHAAALASSYMTTKVTPLNDGDIQIYFESPKRTDLGSIPRLEWVFDTIKLVPRTSVLSEYHVNLKKPFRSVFWEERYEWKNLNDCLVPKSIRSVTPGMVQYGTAPRKETVKYAKTNNVDFHWFSLNTPINEKEFSNSIDDLKLLEASIDSSPFKLTER